MTEKKQAELTCCIQCSMDGFPCFSFLLQRDDQIQVPEDSAVIFSRRKKFADGQWLLLRHTSLEDTRLNQRVVAEKHSDQRKLLSSKVLNWEELVCKYLGQLEREQCIEIPAPLSLTREIPPVILNFK